MKCKGLSIKECINCEAFPFHLGLSKSTKQSTYLYVMSRVQYMTARHRAWLDWQDRSTTIKVSHCLDQN